ncbi:MAG: FtsX-like permease family protein, partial [Planctomycetota bacterium]|nr:FtsX-like permease family protein [Planctomycetota bacterium]
AAISLIVGGIGIMNIMIANVSERTREIGIRRAVGGSRRDIMKQFHTEPMLISILGGVRGLGLGIFAGRTIERIF